MSIPSRIRIGPTQRIPVREDALPSQLNGFWHVDDYGGEIFINANRHRVQKHLTLFHELIHIAEEKLVIGRLIRRRSGEERVGHIATTLFAIIATSGLWTGVSPREAARFYARVVRPPRPTATTRLRTKRNRTRPPQ